VAKVTRADTNEDGAVRVVTLQANGTPYGTNKNIPYADGFVEFETTQTTYGIRLSTAHGTREVSSISLFQGVVSGGTVQANGNGGLQKIAGLDGFNSGASSTNFIGGNDNGYVQFQWGAEFKSQRIGLTYQDVDYESITPFQLSINGNGRVFTNGSNSFGVDDFAEVGDFFRIRHYASTNQVHFQRRQDVYSPHTANFQAGELRRVTSSFSNSGKTLTVGEILTVVNVQSNGGYKYLRSDGTTIFSSASQYTNNTELVRVVGQDYVTFHIHSDFTNGNNLYVDTSLFHIGSQLNDVLLAN